MTARLLTLLLALAALVAGCGTPGGDAADNDKKAEESKKNSAKVDVAKAGPVTLTIWDQEVRGGQAKQIKQLNADFQRTYPNVTIERVAKSFTDLNTTLKLAVSGPKAPDIVQANQGRQVMGALVTGGLLKPMDSYADAYGWNDRWSKTLLDLNRFSSDGKQFGSGDLYGVSQMGEIVGVFYNKDKVPRSPRRSASSRTCSPRRRATARSRSRSATSTSSAASTSSRPSRTSSRARPRPRDFVFAKEGANFDTPENLEAATKLQEWADKGYFTPNFNGTGYDPAWQQFTKGKGPFTIAGTWITADALGALGDKLGFFLMPGGEAGSEPVSLGGESLPWGITAKSKNADVAAAYIDFITNAKAADVLVETDNLPAMQATKQPTAPVNQDIFAAWKALNDADGLTPYMDYATPTFYDDFSGAVQRLLAGKVKPDAFTKSVQEDYAKFADKQ